MDPLLDFLKFALKGEATTPGGWLNFGIVAVLALLVSGSESGNLLMEVLQFGFSVLDRLAHLVEKFLEFLAAVVRARFSACPKPGPYRAPREEGKLSPSLLVVAAVGVICILAVGGARYDTQKKSQIKPRLVASPRLTSETAPP